jgi:GNAT superfamily N-acetyltransferase
VDAFPERIRLEDGSEVLLRPVEPHDRGHFERAFERLGEGSRYRRFLAPKKLLTESELDYLTDVDHVDHEAICAFDAATGEGIGASRYVRFAERPAVAEAAVTVIDEWQGRGVGTLLLDRLTARAEANGVERFSATMLVANPAVRHLLEGIGEVRVLRMGEGTMDVDVELPVERSRLRTALRAAASRGARLLGRKAE